MGLYITLRDGEGSVVREIPDPFGGTFDASGDFDELLNRGLSPLLDAIDLEGETTLTSGEATALLDEVDALLAAVTEGAQTRHGRAGAPWRGLTRFRVMVALCLAEDNFALNFSGD